jgi:thiol-disulfide isomerase/thioredoxin
MSLFFFLHPSLPALQRFADGDAPERERARTARHLEGCARCRAEIASLRALRAEAETLPAPALPSGGFERVLARRAAGERQILPDVAPRPVRLRRTPQLATAAAVLVLLAGWIVLAPPAGLQAGTHDGELLILPDKPTAGARIRLEYRPAARLAAEPQLRVRAAEMTENSSRAWGARVRVVAELTRDRRGVYRAEFVLPDSVVFANLAVEDLRGAHVDANGGQLWEIVVHDSAGRPLYAALRARERSTVRRDWELGFETVQLATELYPDQPEAWRSRIFREIELNGAAPADSIRALYRPHFDTLHQRYAADDVVPAGTMWTMIMWARELGEPELSEYWRERAFREHPADPGVIQQRVFHLFEQRLPLERLMAELEALWQTSEERPMQLSFDAWQLAVRSGDPESIRRWGERLIEEDSSFVSWIGTTWAGMPALQADGLALLREALAHSATRGDEYRDLAHDRREHGRERDRVAQQLLLTHGASLLRTGRAEAALDTLERAATLGWNARATRALGDARLAAGDTAGAVRSFARAAADPNTPGAFADSIRAGFPAHAPQAEWEQWVRAADEEMRAEILATAKPRRLPREMRLADSAGDPVRVPAAHGSPTVVAFLSRWCPPSNDQLPELERIAQTLDERGVRVIAITGEQPGERVEQAFRELGYSRPLLYDLRSEATRGFRSFAAPQFFVVDAKGVVQFEARSAADALLKVAALEGAKVRDVVGEPVQPRMMVVPAAP